MARPSALHSGEPHAPAPAKATRPGRRPLVIGGAVLAAAVAAVAYFTLAHGHGQPEPAPAGAGQSSALDGGGSAIGPGATAPGVPEVTAKRAGGTQVRFSWTYANPAAGDKFLWKREGGSAGAPGGMTAKPEVIISVPPGQSVCVVARVQRASGQASDLSQPVCWPN